MSVNSELLDFIKRSPTAYHAVNTAKTILAQNGFSEIRESDHWDLEKGGKYFTTRNGSSLIAFTVPQCEPAGFMMAAAHADSPAFKIKENEEVKGEIYIRLSTEEYGGGIHASWMDRPLSAAGRIMVREGNGFSVRLVDLEEPAAIIPNVCIHFNRNINSGFEYNNAVDMVPMFRDADGDVLPFRKMIAEKAGVKEEDILSTDIFLYNPQDGIEWNDYVSSPRLDDLQSAFGVFKGFLQAEPGKSLPVYCLFDNEEVGSMTKQGAASTFLDDVLDRICSCLGMSGDDRIRKLRSSFMVSCDNAHAVHPNHPEFRDPNHSPRMNGGIVVKYNAAQHYTTDGVSAAAFRLLCEQAEVPYQLFANRADLRGGGTLGNISTSHVAVNSVDIGLPQLAMHSCFETAGAKDTGYLVKAMALFFSRSINATDSGYSID